MAYNSYTSYNPCDSCDLRDKYDGWCVTRYRTIIGSNITIIVFSEMKIV